jgi:hypothetical protein
MAVGFITQQSDRGTVGTTSEGVPNSYLIGEKCTSPDNSPSSNTACWKVTELGVYCDNSGGGAGAGTFQMAIYTVDGDGDLDELVASTGASSEKDPPSSAGWVEWTGLDIIIDGDTPYAICVWPDDANFDFEGADVGTNEGAEYNSSPGTPWSWGDLNGVSSARSRQLPVYAVYEAAAGGGLETEIAMHHLLKNIGAQ